MKKVVKILFAVVLTLTLIICVAACDGDENKSITSDIESKVVAMNDSIHNEWSKLRPLTVNNEIVIISDENQELVRYNKEYVLLENNIGSILIDTVYLGDENCDLNNRQEMYYSSNKIAMKYSDINGETQRDYTADIDTFMTLVADGANNVFEYNYIYEYFGNVGYEELDGAMKITFEVLDEHVADFLGENGLPVSRMSFSYTMFYDVSKMIVEFTYDTAEGDTSAHVTAKCIAEQAGARNIPDWAL